ncbi:dimethylaniline monooxygenase (N-oxide forming) [Flavobacteriaceae bacterium MAR_2010_72]|nr:dimethylaniline monooxygenase (N-oxide forming) [Flavobacteriaceae bacterium MAR_2010_72]
MISCIVIGAGPGGIVATKELLEKGFNDVLCLEQSSELGGVFTRSYDNLLLTSSVTFSMFSDFWVGEGKSHHFWTKEEAVEYWKNYAEHFKVTKQVRFNSKVESVVLNEDKTWQVTIASGEAFTCDNLVLATGNNNIPRFPEWHSKLTDIIYIHSKDYKNADRFKGKRVLVVGGGESGSDVAYEISQVADQCWVSLRESTGWIVPRKRGDHAADVSTHRGIWDLPRDYGKQLSPFVLKLERGRKDPVFDALADLNDKVKASKGIWGIYGTKTLALPKAIAHHGCKVVDDIVNVENGGKQLTSKSGDVLSDIDAIVFSTGYHNQNDFMPDGLKICDPRQLYKHMFHLDYGDRLAWIGWARPGFGSQFPIMEMQSRYCALIFSKEMKLPDVERMKTNIDEFMVNYKDQFEGNCDRIRSLVDYHHYMNDMSKIIGCRPPLVKYLFTNPKLWLHLIYGPTQATQFRLKGPGKKVKLAKSIIYKLPISTYNHIVKAGLKGRLQYFLKAIFPNALYQSIYRIGR